jgi:hypothetical protein
MISGYLAFMPLMMRDPLHVHVERAKMMAVCLPLQVKPLGDLLPSWLRDFKPRQITGTYNLRATSERVYTVNLRCPDCHIPATIGMWIFNPLTLNGSLLFIWELQHQHHHQASSDPAHLFAYPVAAGVYVWGRTNGGPMIPCWLQDGGAV